MNRLLLIFTLKWFTLEAISFHDAWNTIVQRNHFRLLCWIVLTWTTRKKQIFLIMFLYLFKFYRVNLDPRMSEIDKRLKSNTWWMRLSSYRLIFSVLVFLPRKAGTAQWSEHHLLPGCHRINLIPQKYCWIFMHIVRPIACLISLSLSLSLSLTLSLSLSVPRLFVGLFFTLVAVFPLHIHLFFKNHFWLCLPAYLSNQNQFFREHIFFGRF